MSDNILTEIRGESIKENDICIGELSLHFSLYECWMKNEQRHAYTLSVTSVLNQDIETVCAHDVSSQRDTAVQIYDTVCRELVTPCTLFDVLEELL